MAKVLIEANYFPIDYQEVIHDFMFEQYKESPNLIKYLEAIGTHFEELQDVMIDVLNYREVQNAFGDNLDTLGKLVGQSRPVYDANESLFFGFNDNLGVPGPVPALGMGTAADGSIGGIFRYASQPSSGLTYVGDEDYRIFIGVKIQSNIFEGHTNALLVAIEAMLVSPFITSIIGSTTNPSTLTNDILPFAFDDDDGTEFPDPHDGFGDFNDATLGGGVLQSATAEKKIYIRITDNYDVANRGIQIRFYTRLATKVKSFIKLNNILPKLAGIRYTFQDDNGVF